MPNIDTTGKRTFKTSHNREEINPVDDPNNKDSPQNNPPESGQFEQQTEQPTPNNEDSSKKTFLESQTVVSETEQQNPELPTPQSENSENEHRSAQLSPEIEPPRLG